MTVRAEFRRTSSYVPRDLEEFMKYYCAKYGKTQGEAFEDGLRLLQKQTNGEIVTDLYLNDLRIMIEEMFQKFKKYVHSELFSAFYSSQRDRYAKTDELDLTNLLMLSEILSDMRGELVDVTIKTYRQIALKKLKENEEKKPKE